MNAVKPPVIYRGSRAAAVFYAVPFGVAAELLGNPGLFAVKIGEFGIVHATWFDYAESTIGPYREFSLGIVASPEEQRFRLALNVLRRKATNLGSFVLALPVDSEVARVGGIKHYGLPKTLATLQFRWSTSRLVSSLFENDVPVFSMEIPLHFGVPVDVREMVVFSVRAGRLLTTRVVSRWPAKVDVVGRPKLKLGGDGTHPLVRLARKLGLERARPLAVVHGPLEYAELPEPASDAASNPSPGLATRGDEAEQECPPTPRSAEMSWKPLPVKPQTLQPSQHMAAHSAVTQNDSIEQSGPESTAPATIRSRIQ